MKLIEIANYLQGQLIGADAEFQFVSTDTRKINPGELFIALQGPNFDGHDYVAEAQKKGAIAALSNRAIETTLPIIKVADTHAAMGQLAKLRRLQLKNIPVIALTGSCGKTTVKEMIYTILHECGNTLANQGTLNNDIGVPLTLLRLTAEHRFAVIEMGANHPGEIAYLTDMVKPNVAFINNIAPAHLEGFGSVEGVARAKAEIFQGLQEDGIALINVDDDYAAWLSAQLTDKTILSFGIKNKADIYASDLIADANDRYSFTLHTPQGKVPIQLVVLGQHNVLNALAAAAATLAIGVDLVAIKNGLEKVQPVAGRLVTKQGYNGARIFDDTYNANPSSVKAALNVLAKQTGIKIFAMGEMREMGQDSIRYHREIGAMAKQLGIQHLYACGELSQAAVEGFGEGAHYCATQAELSEAVRALLQPAMTVLVKGSRGMKMENVVAALVEN